MENSAYKRFVDGDDTALEELKEVPPHENLFHGEGQYGYSISLDPDYGGDPKAVPESEWAVNPGFDHQDFWFENVDGSKWVKVVFCHTEFVPWWMNDGIDRRQTEKIPISEVAGTRMLIAERNVGGYYAEFGTEELQVGVTASGCTEEETVSILEYLAEYTGIAGSVVSTDVSVGNVDTLEEDVVS